MKENLNNDLVESPSDVVENFNIPQANHVYITENKSVPEWMRDDDPYIRQYVLGYDNIGVSGKTRTINNARNRYARLGNYLTRNLSDREIARLDNKYNIDQHIFSLAREDVENNLSDLRTRLENGEISDRKFDRQERIYLRQLDNLNKNQLSLDQKQRPLNYITVHTNQDHLIPLVTLGLPLGIIGGVKAAPYLWRALQNPLVQAWGTYEGIKNLTSENGVNKTINHFKNDEYGKGTLSLTGDVLDALPIGAATFSGIRGINAFKNGQRGWNLFNTAFGNTDTMRAIKYVHDIGKKGTTKLAPYIFDSYVTVTDLPETHFLNIGNSNIGNSTRIENLSESITQQMRQQFARAFVKIPEDPILKDYTYLSRLSNPEKLQINALSSKDKFLANRLFKFLDKEGLLKYYTNNEGALTFTPNHPILTLPSPTIPYAWNSIAMQTSDLEKIKWHQLDKFYKQILQNLEKSGQPLDYNSLQELNYMLESNGYFKNRPLYQNTDISNIKIPDMQNVWYDLDPVMHGARLFDRTEKLDRLRRRVKWPMRESNLSPMERIGVPKHERNMTKRLNVGTDLNSDMLLYRVTRGLPSVVGGKIQHISSGPGWIRDLDGNITYRRPLSNTLHTTSDALVQSHIGGNWDQANTVLINTMKNYAKENGLPMTIEPMDTFFATQTPVIPSKGLTVITDNIPAATMYRYMGAKVFINTNRKSTPNYTLSDGYDIFGTNINHPYNYLWPHDYRPQSSVDFNRFNDKISINNPYLEDVRIAGYKYHHPTIKDYQHVADKIGESTEYMLRSDGRRVFYEGLPKIHSSFPNSMDGRFALRTLNFDKFNPVMLGGYIDTFRRIWNTKRIPTNIDQVSILNDWNSKYNPELVEKLGMMFKSYKP